MPDESNHVPLADTLRTLAHALVACAETLQELADVPAGSPTPSPYLPIRQFCQQYPLYTESALRTLLKYRATNGLHTAVVQPGRKVLIDVAAFMQWVEHHKQTLHPITGILSRPVTQRYNRLGIK